MTGLYCLPNTSETPICITIGYLGLFPLDSTTLNSAVDSYFHHANELRSALARETPAVIEVACIRLPSSPDKHLKECKLSVSSDGQDNDGPSRSGIACGSCISRQRMPVNHRDFSNPGFFLSLRLCEPNMWGGEQGSAYACVIRVV